MEKPDEPSKKGKKKKGKNIKRYSIRWGSEEIRGKEGIGPGPHKKNVITCQHTSHWLTVYHVQHTVQKYY